MSDRNDPQAGGIFLLAAIAAGAVIGTVRGQPTIGVLAGTGIGILLALVFWLRDRRRD